MDGLSAGLGGTCGRGGAVELRSRSPAGRGEAGGWSRALSVCVRCGGAGGGGLACRGEALGER